MRMRKAFLSCAVLAATGMLSAPAVMAADLPMSCPAGPWTVTLTGLPSVVTSGYCQSGSCVTATYQVSGSMTPDHVAGLMPVELSNVTGPSPTGNQVYGIGAGDPVFNLGISDVSRRAFKVNPNAAVISYTVWLDGNSFSLGLVPVKIKKGNKGSYVDGACALAGPAVAEVTPNPYATLTPYVEEVLGGKCKVKAETDPQTGETTVTTIESMPGYHCGQAEKIEFENVNIAVTDGSGQQQTVPLKFSEGFQFIAGTGTCAYKQYYPNTGPVYRVCW